MASQESEILAELYRDWSRRMAADPEMPTEQFRALFEEWATVTGMPADVSFEENAVGNIPVMWARPANPSIALLICFHGGGYITGSRASHSKLFGHIAAASNAAALIVEYRRAPEAPYPSALQDALSCYRWALDSGINPANIAFVGDSAGGGLCVSTALACLRDNIPMPAALFLMSPWLDLAASGVSYATNANNDLIVSRPVIQSLVPAVLGQDGKIDDPIANPILADATGLPPILIQVGSFEAFLDDSRTFTSNARNVGVEVDLEVVPEMQHVFQFLAGTAPEADDAIRRAGDWLSKRLTKF